MEEKRRDHFLAGVLIGSLMGLATGILMAPKSGAEMRDELAERANSTIGDVKSKWNSAQDKMSKQLQSASKSAGQLKDALSTQADKLQQKILNFRERVETKTSKLRNRISDVAEKVRDLKKTG